MEIGFGNGDHLLHLATLHPEANLIGIEISNPSLRKAMKKVVLGGYDNVFIIDGSGPNVLQTTFQPPMAITQLHVNFPDPWPKGNHQHRRIINDHFLHLAATRMNAGALLFVATDHADYQPVVTDCLLRSPYFESRLPTPFVTTDPDRFHTKYELKAEAEGRTSQFYKWIRNTVSAENIFPIPLEFDMPHVIINTPLTLNDIHAAFQPQQWRSQDGVTYIKLMHSFSATQSPNRAPAILFETHIQEEPHAQRIGFSLTQRDDGDFILSLHEMGFPRPTAGIHFAARHIKKWLQSLHPETIIVHHNLRTDIY